MILIIPDQKLKDLYAEMYNLTKNACTSGCLGGRIGSCCSEEYCEIVKEYAQALGIELDSLRSSSGCQVEPWLRPMCTLHICERLLFNNRELSQKYFELRESICQHEDFLFLKQKRVDNGKIIWNYTKNEPKI